MGFLKTKMGLLLIGVLTIFIFVKVGLALSAHGVTRIQSPEEFKEEILKTILSGENDFQVLVENYTSEEYDIAKILDEITIDSPEISVVFKGAINGSVKGYLNRPDRMVEYTFLYRDIAYLDTLHDIPIIDSAEALKGITKKAFEEYQETLMIKINEYQEERYPIGSLVESVVHDYPILGTGYKGVESTIYGEGNDIILRMKLSFHFDEETRKKMIADSYEKVEKVVKDLIMPDMKAYEKLLILHNYVVEQARYDTENYRLNKIPPTSRTVYGILVDGIGVCEGYANALKVLLDEAGVVNQIIVGTAGGEAHAWNLVQVEGDYYHVDSTWNDPVTTSGKQMLRHDYYALNDLEMSNTHQWETSDYPNAISTRYDHKKTQLAIAKDEKVRELARLNESNEAFRATRTPEYVQNISYVTQEEAKNNEDTQSQERTGTFVTGMPAIENTQTYLRKLLKEKNFIDKNESKQDTWDSVIERVESEVETKSVEDRTIRLRIGDDQYTYQGQSKPIDTIKNVRPFLVDGRTMVPLRFIVESMGGKVQYDLKNQIIRITAEGKTISLRVGGSAAIVNGGVLYMDVPIQVMDNRSYVPLRFVSEGLGLRVKIMSETKEIELNPFT